MTARVYCAVLLCLAGCWSSTEAAPGQNFTAKPANNEKCCSNGCGLQCMAPVTVNPGVCPSTRYEAAMCALIRFVSCADDSDCTNNQKCCSNGCGLQCMAPVTVNPGVCPKTNSEIRCIKKDEELCADDSECPKNQKCCRTACGGTQCTGRPVTVKPGVCPKTNAEKVMCKKKDEELCADDSECPKNQKCCGTACGGTRCTTPVTVKPGVCPKTKSELVKCIMMGKALCADDSECPKNQKCCGTACGGTQCTTPVTVKPGVCPKTKSELVKCIMMGKALCAGDSECPKDQKCCGTACGGTRCMAPVTVKPGVCPKTNGELIRCSKKDEELCADDSECPKNEKCCGTACSGTQCTGRVTGKVPY